MRERRVGHVAQVEETGCGPAALCAVLRSFGHDVSLAELSAACDPGRDGVSMAVLAKVAEMYGVAASGRRAPMTPKGVQATVALRGPVIALLKGGHYVILDGQDRAGRVRVIDPARDGVQRERPEDLSNRFTGLVLAFPPAADATPPPVHTRRPTPVPLAWWRDEEAADRGFVLAAALCAVVTAAATVCATLAVRQLVTAHDRVPLLWTGAGAALLAVLASWSRKRFGERALTRSSTRRSSSLVRALFCCAPSFFHKRHAAELATRPQRVDSAAITMNSLLVGGVAEAITATGLFLALLILLPLAALVLATGGVAAALLVVLGRRADRSLAEAELSTAMSRDSEILDGLLALETVMAEASGADLIGRWQASASRHRATQRRITRRAQLRQRFGATLYGAAMVAAVLLSHAEPRGTLLALVVLGLLLQQSAQQLAQTTVELRSVAATGRLVQDVQSVAGATPADPAKGGCPALDVRLESVTAGHQRFRPPVLRDLDLAVDAGDRVFVTGRSGSGKSTLCGLLSGALQPYAGEITAGGRPIALGDGAVRVVPQRPVILAGTVTDNLCLGRQATSERLWQVLRLVELDRVVADRGGLHATIDQNGRNLSGGERQRLALARALVELPGVLVLDEATSNVEAPLEDRIFDRLRSLDCTMIVVAHRLPTLQRRERVVTVTDGRVRVDRNRVGAAA